MLLRTTWPGNVRELENALEFAATVAQGQTLQPEDLPPEILDGVGSANDPEPSPPLPTGASRPGARGRGLGGATRRGRSTERDAVARALEAHAWNRVDTAKTLGVSRSTLWRWMRTLGLE